MVFFSVPSRDMHKDTLNNQQTKYRMTNLASVKESSQGLAKKQITENLAFYFPVQVEVGLVDSRCY